VFVILMDSCCNSGFNVVLTALLNIAYVGGSYYVIKKSNTPIAVGFLIGVTAMLVTLSLMTAIFWGQLRNCEAVSSSIDQYSCTQKVAYGAVSAFAAMLFVVQSVFFGALVSWRGELIDEVGMYDDISSGYPGGAGGNAPYEPTRNGSFDSSHNQPSAVDL
jgi:hypothetical protein